MRKRLVVIGLIILWLTSWVVGTEASARNSVTVYLFWGDGCPLCLEEELFLRDLAEQYEDMLQIKDYEIWYHPENKALLLEMAEAHDIEADGVPVAFAHGRGWVGFSETIAEELAQTIEAAIRGEPVEPNARSTTIRLPFGKEIDLKSKSLLWATVIIGFVDGMNPCSLWVLSLLLAMILRSGSRHRTMLVGTTFLIVTSLIYGLFMVGVFSALSYVGYLRWIQILVALVAFLVGAVNIKEYFAFGQGPSLTISEEDKPRLYQDIRTIMVQKSPIATIGTTAFMAAGACLVELPCTAGFPILWSNLLMTQGIGRWEFGTLLLIYMLMYLLDELVIFVAAVVTLRTSRLQERHGRLLKLVGGSLMVAFAGALVIKPELMNEVSGTLLVFLAAVVLAVMAALVRGGAAKSRQTES